MNELVGVCNGRRRGIVETTQAQAVDLLASITLAKIERFTVDLWYLQYFRVPSSSLERISHFTAPEFELSKR